MTHSPEIGDLIFEQRAQPLFDAGEQVLLFDGDRANAVSAVKGRRVMQRVVEEVERGRTL